MPHADSKTVVTVRISETMKAKLQEAANEKGGNLSAEILHRLTEHESLLDFVDRLLDDSVAINLAVGLETLRKGAEISPADNISDKEAKSLERAVITAACASRLFGAVAEYTAHALATKRAARLAEGWAQRIDAGDLAHDFDIPTMADKISTGLSKLASLEGEQMAVQRGAVIGPHIWDICFDKKDPLRSDSLHQLLDEPGIGLPPLLAPPPSTNEGRLSLAERLNEIDVFGHTDTDQAREGQPKENGGKKTIDLPSLDDLLKPFGMAPDEAASDAPES